MKKRIAILTQKGALSKDLQIDTTINLFSIEDEKVKKVENLQLKETSNRYFILLMKIKKVSIVYTETINTELKNTLAALGITTKCKEEMNNDKFINQFIFD